MERSLGLCGARAAALACGEAGGLGTPAAGPGLFSRAWKKRRLEPSPEADKATLLRRVSFDLTGLPPTAEEQAAFLADSAPDAYEKQVARLLASPRYGERWASMWLDLARYADTKGYENDRARPGVWPYRDWVIDAFNRNLPYDQFVIKQLAGDLLPNATFEDRIATSFHRQTPNNEEGGTDDEEFRMVAVMDRVATTWSVLNGLTMNCVQCHSHPYDPIRHTDYYKSLAFFNTQDDADLDDDSPNLTVPNDKARYSQAEQIQDEIAKLLHAVETSDRQVDDNAHWKPLPVSCNRTYWMLCHLRAYYVPRLCRDYSLCPEIQTCLHCPLQTVTLQLVTLRSNKISLERPKRRLSYHHENAEDILILTNSRQPEEIK